MTDVRARSSRRADPRRRGAVLLITLLSMTLIVALIFFVYNIGDQVNRRLETQNAADAVAIGSSTWMARHMNLIAANNIAQTRLMALALVLDSLPIAAEMTVAEETATDKLPDAIKSQLERGVPHRQYEVDDFLRRGLQEIYDQMSRDMTPEESTHLEFIEAIDKYLDQKDERQLEGSFDVRSATEWFYEGGSGSGPQGSIWQACMAMDEFSQAAEASAGVIAARNAARYARYNRSAGFSTPVLPVLPARRGQFSDWEPPFLRHLRITEDDAREVDSRLVPRLANSPDLLKDIEKIHVQGGSIPDFQFPHRLGPFARCWGWRYYWHQRTGPWWEGGTWYKTGYSTYGPLENAVRTILHGFGLFGSSGGLAFTSRMPFHLRRVSTLKLAYMFGLSSPREIQYADRWIVDHEEAKKFTEEGVPVDDQTANTQYQGTWKESPVQNEDGGSSRETTQAGARATFTATLPAAGGWRVDAWWGHTNGRQQDTAARFTINYSGGTITVTKNQNSQHGRWVSLGTYNFEKGQTGRVVIERGPDGNGDNGPTIADAVRFVPVSVPRNKRPQEARDKEQVVLRTRYYRVGVTSSVHWDNPNWLNNIQSTYKLAPEQQIRFHSSQLADRDGGTGTTVGDPKQNPLQHWAWEPDGNVPQPRGSNLTKLNDYVWTTHSENHHVIEYEPFGWPPRPIFDSEGNIIGYDYYTLYHYSWYVWGGIEIRDPVLISNPLEGVSRSEMNAPMLMDFSEGDYSDDHDTGWRRDRFTYLGAARQSGRAAIWNSKFYSANPINSMVALAQAEVFNNRSWDLWTQEWRAQLVPLTGWEDWTQRMSSGMPDVQWLDGEVSSDEISTVMEYLRGLSPELADQFRSQ